MAKQQRPTETPLPSYPWWVSSLLFAVFTAVFFLPVISSSGFFWEDFAEQVWPFRHYAAEALSQGVLPFWNPYSFNGMPFLADVQTGVFYLPWLLLTFFIGSDGLLSVQALQLAIVAHFFVAQQTMFAYTRSRGASFWASTLAGVSYGFGGLLVCHAFHPMMVAHFAWFPLVLLLFRRGLDTGAWSSVMLAGLVFGLSLLAGHPQSALYLSVFLVLVAKVSAFDAIRNGASGAVLRMAGMTVATVALAGGVFAIQLLPSQELAANSERNEMTYEAATDGSLQMKQFVTGIVPRAFGVSGPETQQAPPFAVEGQSAYHYWETAFYFGVVLTLFGLVWMFSQRHKDKESLIALGALAFGGLYALGGNGFLFGLLFELPFFDSFRIPSRMMILVPLAFGPAAALAFDGLFRKQVQMRDVLIPTGIAFLPAMIVSAGLTADGSPNPDWIRQQGYTAAALVLAGAGMAYALLTRRLSPGILGPLAVAIAFFDLYVAYGSFNIAPNNPKDEYTRVDNATMQALRATPPTTFYRVQMREEGFMLMKRNQGPVSKVFLYEGYNPLLLARRNPPAPTPDGTKDQLGIRYSVVVDRAQGSAMIAERPTAMPHARMAYAAVISTPEESAQAMKTLADVRNTVVLEQPSPVALSGKAADSVAHKVTWTSWGSESFSYEIETAEPGIAVFSEMWYPAWKAYVDGQPAEILRTNWSLRGVALPAGKHKVEMRYESDAFSLGSLISAAATALALALAGVFSAVERKKKA